MPSPRSRQCSTENSFQLSFAEALFLPERLERETIREAPVLELRAALVPVYSVQLRRVGVLTTDRQVIRSPADAARIFEQYGLPDKDREHLGILILDTKNQIIGIHTASIGVLDCAICNPREVFKVPILLNAACIVLAHNHPSGDPTPSHEDRRITKRIAEAGELLAIDLLDHVILGDAGRYLSLKEIGVF